jgi:shikimate 5-dehydrogenase
VLVAQGALSFQLWTGRTAPIQTMRDAARALDGAPPAPARRR